ncbi:MAG: c-type cytochrome [Calditerrivibrio sp.]
MVKGFDPVMQSFKGIVTNEELNAIIQYFKNNLSDSKISAVEGKKIFEREGCSGCHSTDGSVVAGHSLKGLYNLKETVIKNGKSYEITVDDEYLFVAIKYPDREIVKGFDNIMPSFSNLSDEEVKNLIEYIKSLK